VDGVAISNLKVGMVCGKLSDPEICAETNDIQVTGEGRCVFVGKVIPCTWYGYSFDYQSNGKPVKLQCNSTSSVPVNEGNPRELIKASSQYGEFELELTGDSSHFVNPLYSGSNSSFRDAIKTTSCSYKGKEIFSYKVTLHYPGGPGTP